MCGEMLKTLKFVYMQDSVCSLKLEFKPTNYLE